MRGSGGGDARSGLLRNDEPRLFLGEAEVCAVYFCSGLYGRVVVVCVGGCARFVAGFFVCGQELSYAWEDAVVCMGDGAVCQLSEGQTLFVCLCGRYRRGRGSPGEGCLPGILSPRWCRWVPWRSFWRGRFRIRAMVVRI